ncbi:MAG: hypothetical protein IBJ10_11110, partial [Phycisphaerales bacterium]|nr:hypothetical protein [Phycisphaerales bacterium]
MPILAFAAAALTTSAAMAGAAGSGGTWKAFRDPTVQDHGFQWSRVGDPHNTPFVYDDPSIFIPPRDMGRTNYKYRIMTREVTVREWFGFVQAYAPYVAFGTAQSSGLLGDLIQYHGYSNGLPQYSLPEQNANKPMRASWRMAARFA